MPVKHQFIFKTVVRGSDNVTPTELLITTLGDLKRDACNETKGDVEMEINVVMENNVITVNDMDVDGTPNSVQTKGFKVLHEQALKSVNNSGGPEGRIKVKFIFKM